MNETYEAWNQAFIAEYFPEGNLGRLAWLPVDDDEIRALAKDYKLADPAAAVDEFPRVINAWLATKGGSFTRFSSGISGWRRVRDTPPYVAGLAFCVLAASRMERDASARIASHNYYAQLNRMIGRGDAAGQPPGFDQLGDVWRDFARWLEGDCEGSRGLSTFRTNYSVGKHVGFPMSQALLRASDRRRLPDFFRSAGLEPGSEVSAERVFSLLRAWAALPSCGLTARARAAIAGAEDIDLREIAETVLRELRAWDGELRDARGRLRASIHLLVIPRRRATIVRLLARQPEDFPDGSWAVSGGTRELTLTPHATAGGWFAPLDSEVSAGILQDGFRLTRGDLALSFEPADAVPCRQAAAEIGGYISQPQATMFEPHLAVVRRALIPRLSEYAGRYAEPPLAIRPSPPGFPPAWALTSEFRFVKRPQAAPAEFGRLAPRLVATTSFSGGLELSPGVYLTGGEPDVNIATDEGSVLVPALDGLTHPLEGGALTLRLSEMSLAPGEHELSADVTKRFSTRETLGDLEPPAAGSLGYKLSRHTGYRPQSTLAQPLGGVPPAGWIHISGALALAARRDLPLPDRRPVLARCGALRYVLLGEHGEIARPASIKPPAWLASLGLADTFQFVDVKAGFEPVWLLRESQRLAREVVPLHPDPPPPSVSGAPPEEWAEALAQWAGASVPEPARARWAEYVAAGGGNE